MKKIKPMLFVKALRSFVFTCACLFFLSSQGAQAKFIQILHTNDLHASLLTAGAPKKNEDAYGGWAQVKATLDHLTEVAKQQGIETIRLDAGDFFEGTSFYFPDHGSGVLAAFQSMGYDAAALGNHEWLMGARALDQTFGNHPFPFPILAANVKIAPELKNLSKQILPSTQIIRDSIRIGVLGLTTTENFYAWYAGVESKKNDLKIISNPDPEIAIKLHENNDLVIALTHIGFEEDKKLVQNTRGIDLVIGGHSHTFLETWDTEIDPDGNSVHIVQTGVNGNAIGKILLKVEPGKKPEILFYELVPVLAKGPKDALLKAKIKQANQQVEKLYTHEKLNAVLGHSEVRLLPGDQGPSAFSQFAVEAMRDSIHADAGIDVGSLHGNTPQAAGKVTLRNLIELYPRKFEASHQQGLWVYRTRIPGWALWFMIKYAVKWGIYISTSQLTYDVQELSDAEYEHEIQSLSDRSERETLTRFRAGNIKIKNQEICKFCSYDVAMPESLVRGAYAITPLTQLIVHKGLPTGVTIWDAMSTYLKKIGTIKKLSPDALGMNIRFSTHENLETNVSNNAKIYEPGEAYLAPWSTGESSTDAGITQLFQKMIQVTPNDYY